MAKSYAAAGPFLRAAAVCRCTKILFDEAAFIQYGTCLYIPVFRAPFSPHHYRGRCTSLGLVFLPQESELCGWISFKPQSNHYYRIPDSYYFLAFSGNTMDATVSGAVGESAVVLKEK